MGTARAELTHPRQLGRDNWGEPMTWTTTEAAQNGMLERDFSLVSSTSNSTIPGVYRSPIDGPADRLVLLGHGGTRDKRVDYLVQVAQLLAQRGIASLAIDGPGHGDRATFEFTGHPEEFATAWNGGGGTDGVLADWRDSLDFVESELGVRPTGWWGLSMGTMMGLPVSATEERIRCAVLGLMGTWGPNRSDLERLAPELDCPIRFLVQWDDEVVPKDRALELFGLIGTRKKTLHANPGIHIAVPQFEVIGSVDYLDHHLS
jgi:pimeloyl-ACP methyl ester carboxylesterase